MQNKLEQFFSKATQSVFTLIENLLNKRSHHSCDLNDLFYFGCVFLGIIASRLNSQEQMNFKSNLREILNTAAQDGLLMCSEIMSANLTTEEDREKAMKQLANSLKGSGTADSSLLTSIAGDINILEMKEDSQWKDRSNFKYEPAVEKAIQVSLEDLAEQVINDIPRSKEQSEAAAPELFFLVTMLINVGLMAGYISTLYKQSLEELLAIGVNKINELINFSEKNKSLLH